MRIFVLFPVLFLAFSTFAQTSTDEQTIRKLLDEALTRGHSYQWLDYLSNQIGGRLSGSPQAAAAVEWSRQVMDTLGFDRVYLQEVMAPRWVRGDKETARIINSRQLGSLDLNVCALGGSVGTGLGGITAEVIEVKSLQEVKELGRKKLEGKIVFYNRPMDPAKVNTFEAYAGAVDQRGMGATEAAKYGALGVIVRSMTTALDDYPHTGGLRYDPRVKQIPAAAVSTRHAELLSRLLKDDPGMQIHLRMNCRTLPEVLSYNVIGEIRGSTHPEEIIAVGGHLDSWDLGDGSHDDGAGCVQAMEVLRLFRQLGIRPKRTLRAVMFMNEENGLRGGIKYAEQAKQLGEKHLAAIESDRGGFTPKGFSIDAVPDQVKKIQSWKSLFEPYGISEIIAGGGGADIGPLKDQKVILIGYLPDSQRYFDYHHSGNDTFDKVNQRELELGAAAMAALVYLLDEHGVKETSLAR